MLRRIIKITNFNLDIRKFIFDQGACLIETGVNIQNTSRFRVYKRLQPAKLVQVRVIIDVVGDGERRNNSNNRSDDAEVPQGFEIVWNERMSEGHQTNSDGRKYEKRPIKSEDIVHALEGSSYRGVHVSFLPFFQK
jgi:hypothetical protein